MTLNECLEAFPRVTREDLLELMMDSEDWNQEAVMNDVRESPPAVTPKPVFAPLPLSDPWEACDRCPDVRALVSVLLPAGGILVFCGSCARKNFGYEHTAYAKPENRAQGSDHA